MTDEMTPERLAEIKATATQHRPGTDYAEHVPALITEVERLTALLDAIERDGTAEHNAAAETRATAAEAKLAEAERRIDRLLLTQRRLFEGEHVRLLEEAEERAVTAVIALGEIARAVMREVEPTMGERMRCVRLARAFLGSPDKEKSDACPSIYSRITYDDNGKLDEVVTDAGCHLEHLGGKSWFLNCLRSDGSSFAIWFTGTITMTEERCARNKESTP